MTEYSGSADTDKTGISLYEFYAIGIERLLRRAPWELERAVSAYHESFLTEQRCIGLSILLLLGEEHVSSSTVSTMPGYETQARSSVNQATFLRALKHYFQATNLNPVRADMAVERMQSYLSESRAANEQGSSPLEAMTALMSRRVPPQTDGQKQQYTERVDKIYAYIEGLVERTLLARYTITS